MLNDSFRNLTILLVDDERYSRTTVVRMLSGLGHPTVLEAENGADALSILDEHKVDFIISDFNMPGVDGLQFLRAVRMGEAAQNKPDTPFALFTGYSELKLANLAIALDVNAFLLKPISRDGLYKRIALMLKQTKATQWLKDKKVYQDIDVGGVRYEVANANALISPQQPLAEEPPTSQRAPIDPVEVRGLNRPSSGPIEVRGLEEQYRPEHGDVEVRGLPEVSGWDESSESDQGLRHENSGGAIAHEQSTNTPRVRCDLDQLPEKAVLAIDVYTAQGTLFMFAGTKLTPRLIAMLYRLHDLGHPLKGVWIEQHPINSAASPEVAQCGAAR